RRRGGAAAARCVLPDARDENAVAVVMWLRRGRLYMVSGRGVSVVSGRGVSVVSGSGVSVVSGSGVSGATLLKLASGTRPT
ncbi:MAG: hypothetical protein ACRDK7_12185, partial [Solirubrobacteraceae bacterium]